MAIIPGQNTLCLIYETNIAVLYVCVCYPPSQCEEDMGCQAAVSLYQDHHGALPNNIPACVFPICQSCQLNFHFILEVDPL